MPVTEEPVASWRDPVLRYKKNKYLVPLDPSLPRLYFVSLFVGSRGSGKTYSAVKLLKAYELAGIADADSPHTKVGQRVVLFSPTHDANPVFTSLAHLDEADIDTDTKLLEVVEDVKREREATAEYRRLMRLYRKFLRCRSIDELEADELFELQRMDCNPPQEPRYPNGCVTFFVLDDLIGSSAFKSTGKSRSEEYKAWHAAIKSEHPHLPDYLIDIAIVTYRSADPKWIKELVRQAKKEERAAGGKAPPRAAPTSTTVDDAIAIESFIVSVNTVPANSIYFIESNTLTQGNSYSTLTKSAGYQLMPMVGSVFTCIVPSNLLGIRVRSASIL
ncbi:hypothetical protein GPECTOR_42g789 [Gonium pectorale]|uniref:Uncharacterized protein n=1 Tax=Gonium pectorale TaxID=33097 RepID=A0A150G9S2_GONPE|nr:hypothetical protein GPECTOR_42g789 [Gonium pectorale]|eukprot:KXZ46578.1 hypothetical protein GPECTOR_42g789 [Gonium pectorale]